MLTFLYQSIIFLITWLFHTMFAASGLGGGIILIPTFVAFGILLPIAVAAGLTMNVISLSVVTAHNLQHRIILWRLGTAFLIPALGMTYVGSYASSFIPGKYVIIVFIVLLIYAFYHILMKSNKAHRERILGRTAIAIAIPIGILTGFLSGLAGIGGGLIVLPALTFMVDDYKKISATTGYVALFTSASSLTSHLSVIPQIPAFLWVVIIGGSILGGLTASYLIHTLSSRKISIITGFIIVIVVGVLIHSLI